MKQRIVNAWTVATNAIFGIVGAYAGRSAVKHVLTDWASHLDVQNNQEDLMLFIDANHRTGQDYVDVLLDNPKFRLWSYRAVRDKYESLLRYHLRELYIARMERA